MIYYLGYFTTAEDLRVNSPAANAKIESISMALAQQGKQVEILSTCTTASRKGYIPGRRFSVGEGIWCKQYGFLSSSSRVIRALQYYWANIRIFLTLLCKVRRKDTVIMYHAVERSSVVLRAKKIRNFRLVLEVEEIYADACQLSSKNVALEQKMIEIADEYIFSTVLLNRKLNAEHKPYVVINGTYRAEEKLQTEFNDGRIHVVYAGTLNPIKGGAMATVGAAEFLNERYHVHILGFGSPEEIQTVKGEAERVSACTDCRISYDGYLRGEPYLRFLQSCQIGLSTQNPVAEYNDTSFPSKILTYLANGLQVVSVRIPAVETAEISPYMHYYEHQTPIEIAQAIQKVDLQHVEDSRKIIEELNRTFSEKINRMI